MKIELEVKHHPQMKMNHCMSNSIALTPSGAKVLAELDEQQKFETNAGSSREPGTTLKVNLESYTSTSLVPSKNLPHFLAGAQPC